MNTTTATPAGFTTVEVSVVNDTVAHINRKAAEVTQAEWSAWVFEFIAGVGITVEAAVIERGDSATEARETARRVAGAVIAIVFA